MSLWAAWAQPSRLEHIPALFARLKEVFYLSFASGSVAVMLVGRCCPIPSSKYIPLSSRAEENKARSVTSHWCLERLGSFWASSLIHRHGVIALTVRRMFVWGVINATKRQLSWECVLMGINGSQIRLDFDKNKSWVQSWVNSCTVVHLPKYRE